MSLFRNGCTGDLQNEARSKIHLMRTFYEAELKFHKLLHKILSDKTNITEHILFSIVVEIMKNPVW